MAVLKRIGVLSMGKVYGLIGVIVGLIFGIISTLFGIAVLGVRGVGFGGLSIILFPIMFGIVMFIMGVISAFLYNLIAGRVGGVELEFDQEKSR